MKRTAIGAGAYVDESGRYWARPEINHRRTWRRLKSTTQRKAIQEAAGTSFSAKGVTFAALAQLWQDSGCPGKRGRPRDAAQLKDIPWRLDHLKNFFGKFLASEIRLLHLPAYAEWRRKQLKRKSRNGGRTVDLDLVTLSNILRFGVFSGHLAFNHIRSDRPRYQENVRHARSVMPESAEIIHAIAGELLGTVRSEVMAWHAFFAEFTGCRTSELLRLRTDAKNNQAAGFIEWLSKKEMKERGDDTLGHLYLGRRSKNGLNPWAKIGPEFAEMLRAFQHWHRTRYRPEDTPWFFPGHSPAEHIGKLSFGHAIVRTTKQLKLTHITPHGFRAFYATKRLRDGARPVDIAAEMGDRTVSLIEQIYADNPDGKKLWWAPADGLPAWSEWVPKKELDSFGTTTAASTAQVVPRHGLEP